MYVQFGFISLDADAPGPPSSEHDPLMTAHPPLLIGLKLWAICANPDQTRGMLTRQIQVAGNCEHRVLIVGRAPPDQSSIKT